MLDINNIKKGIVRDNYRKLPIYYPSPIYYALYAALRFSMILSNPNTYSWFYSNFIQLSFDYELFEQPGDTNHAFHIYPVDDMKNHHKGASLVLDEIFLNDDVFDFNQEAIIEHIIEWINKDYYVITHVDVSKVPGTKYYNKSPLFHSLGIYGYDLENKCFKHMDFNSNGDFSEIDVTFKCFIDAFFSNDIDDSVRIQKSKSKHYFFLYKVNNDINFKLDLDTIMDSMYDYLNSINTAKKNRLILPERKGVYGLGVYETLGKSIKLTADKYEKIDYRSFHALYEHKKLMVERLKHLETVSLIDSTFQFSKKYEVIERMVAKLRMDVLRYSITKDNYSIGGMQRLLNDIYIKEKVIVSDILNI
jgi:hypothetical protein